MSSQRFITAEELHGLLKNKREDLKVLDCTYQIGPKPDPTKHAESYLEIIQTYLKNDTPQFQTYAKSHIPNARHFNLDYAMNPGEFERFSFLEPEKFQEYIQILGINRDDHIVLYSRGPFGGMLFAARAYWIFKCYGHENISILNGGFDAWSKAGYETETSDATETPTFEKGNWSAQYCVYDHITNFFDLTKKDPRGKDAFEKPDELSILDARPPNQFNNEADCGFDKSKVHGSHILGTKNVPCGEFVDENGLILPENKIKEKLEKLGFDNSKPTITMCALGIQASMLATIIDSVYSDAPLKVYNGSLKEIELREPERINGPAKK